MSKFPTKEDQEDEISIEREIRMNEGPDLSYRDEMRSLQQESQIEKLNQRVSLLLILVPCLLGAIFLFAYLDLKRRVYQVRDMGSTEVKALSDDVVDQVGSLSHQYKALEKSFAERVPALEKSSVSITEDLKRDKREIKKLTASKVDKKALEQALKEQSAEAAKTLAVLQNDLQEQKRVVENLNKTLKKEMAGIIQVMERIRDDGQKQDSAIKNLSKRKLDKEVLDKLLENERTSYEATISLLQKEITSLKKEVLQLQKQLNITSAPEAESTPAEKKPAAEASTDTLSVAPGKIIEQEIAE